MVIWITGLSGSGKTTLCQAIWDKFESQAPEMVMVDGDIIREMYEDNLGFDQASRVKQIKRIQRLTKVLAEQGKMVLVAALYADDELLSWNRENFTGYTEVYIDASLQLVKNRDSKGLYAKAARGETNNVVGIDIEWNTPKQPDIVIDPHDNVKPEELALQVARKIPRLAKLIDE